MKRPEPPEPARTPGRARRLAESVHLFGLTLWLGAVVMAGGVAAIVFPTARELDPTLPAYAAYDGSHADLAAGFLQNRVFALADGVQFLGAVLALATTILLVGFMDLPLRRISSAVRLCGLGLALGLLSFYLLMLMPRMQENVRTYWAAAAAGQLDAAASSKAAFDADHPTASNTLKLIGVSVLVTIVGAGWSASTPGSTDPKPDSASDKRARGR